MQYGVALNLFCTHVAQEEMTSTRDDVASLHESESPAEPTDDETIFRYQKLSPPVVYMGWVEIKGDVKAQAFKLSEDTLEKVSLA
jgi:hypothetical protein